LSRRATQSSGRRYAPEIELLQSLAPLVGPFARYAQERILLTLTAAERQGPLIAELAKGMNERPALAALVVNALEGARRSHLDAKARAFGRAIAIGFTDDAQINVALMIVRTIDALEMTHLEALEVMHEASEFSVGTAEITRRFGEVAVLIIDHLTQLGLLRGQSIDWQSSPTVPGTHPNLTFYGERVRAYVLDLEIP
jgi:hypothetical protein